MQNLFNVLIENNIKRIFFLNASPDYYIKYQINIITPYIITDSFFWFSTGECRTLQDDNYRLQRLRRDDKSSDYMGDGTASDEDEDSEETSPDAGGANTMPSILTSGLVVETIEGTTVNLPCKIANSSGK